MPKARLIFDGDGVYTEKEARIHKLTQETETKIDNIPGIVDDVNSTSTTDALSANMGKYLQDQINNISGTTIFLSTWDCTTGLPETDPAVDPYTYKTGNYYIVGKVASSGGTNYRPHGATYTHGVPSTSVETQEINVNDWYIYDGQTWVIQPASTVAIVIDDMLKPNSTNAVENRAIYSAVSQKQDKILDLAEIRAGAAAGANGLQPGDNITELVNNAGYQTAGDVAVAIEGSKYVGPSAPSNPTEGMLWYDTTNDQLKVYDGTQWNVTGKEYIAGKNITINGTTINAEVNTRTFYIASTSDTDGMQRVINYLDTGNNPIVDYGDSKYTLYAIRQEGTDKVFYFYAFSNDTGSGIKDNLQQTVLMITQTSGGTYSMTTSVLVLKDVFLSKTNNTSYTPSGNYNPATKKYVDDTVSSATEGSKYVGPSSPSNPTEGMLWYDTTNNILKVYNGTSWVNVDTNTTYSNGTYLTLTGTTFDVDTTTIATKSYVDTATEGSKYVGPTAPSSPTEGMLWYDTTNDVLKAYDGTSWNIVGNGDMTYSDFNFQTKTGTTITLSLNSTITPSANFTVNAPSTIKDGQIYILRVTNSSTAYTMTLGTNITNPYGTDITLTANGIDQFTFLAIGGNLELQPDMSEVLRAIETLLANI